MRLLTSHWFLEFLGVVALGLLIWFGGPYLTISGTEPLAKIHYRVLAIGAVVLIWVASILIRLYLRYRKARKANKELVENLASSEGLVSLTEARSQEEINLLAERFQRAMDLLGRHAVDRRGGHFVYELPWYLVIGPPGSGKTTVIRNSGLEFPLAEEFGTEAVQGIGGTRNCDWWFTDQAVLLDTAGRYTTQDSNAEVDSAAWHGFLRLLRDSRPRQPINGVIIALPLSDLMDMSDDARLQTVLALRNRLQESMRILGVRLPIYVVFTKCDLVAGFPEFFDNLDDNQRQEVWGTTFPMEQQGQPMGSVTSVGADFDRLMARLEQRLLRRLDDERDPQRRALIYIFPQEMMSLRSVVVDFLTEAFRPSRYEMRPLLRGVYFTSATQEGAPSDRIMGSLTRLFGLAPVQLPPFEGQPRTYFITRLLQSVVFREADLAGVNRPLERRLALRQWGAVGLALASLLVIGTLWWTSYAANRENLYEIVNQVGIFRQKQPPAGDVSPASALPALNAMRGAERVYGADPSLVPALEGLGLYEGMRVAPVADSAYLRALQTLFLPRVLARMEQQISEGMNNPPYLKQALRIYLMMGSPERLDPDAVVQWMSLDWQQLYGYDQDMQNALEDHLRVLLNNPLPQIQLDQGLISQARGVLTRQSVPEQIYAQLQAEAAQAGLPSFSLLTTLGTYGARVFTLTNAQTLTIDGFYTQNGFYNYFIQRLPQISQDLNTDSWIYGTGGGSGPSSQDVQQVTEQVTKLYTADYISRWQTMLDSVQVAKFNSVSQASDVLKLLSGQQSPLQTMLQAVQQNTNLVARNNSAGSGAAGAVAGAAQAAAGQAGAKIGGQAGNQMAQTVAGQAQNLAQQGLGSGDDWPGKAVIDHFRPLNNLVASSGGGASGGSGGATAAAPGGQQTPLKQLIQEIGVVYGDFAQITSGGDPQQASFKTVADFIQKGGSDPLANLRLSASQQPQPVQRWLESVADNAWGALLGAAKGYIVAAYDRDVLPVCQQKIAGRYPIDRKGQNEVTVQDFGSFFGAKGTMDNFFQTYLAPFVNTQTDPWSLIANQGQTLGISKESLAPFQQAAKIQATFLPAGAKTPKVPFTLTPSYMDSSVLQFLLNYGSTTVDYRHGPYRATSLTWPPDGEQGVRVTFVGLGNSRVTTAEDGQWAWFRMLDKMKVADGSAPNIFNITFSVSGRTAIYEMKAESAVNPFQMKAMDGFQCPASL